MALHSRSNDSSKAVNKYVDKLTNLIPFSVFSFVLGQDDDIGLEVVVDEQEPPPTPELQCDVEGVFAGFAGKSPISLGKTGQRITMLNLQRARDILFNNIRSTRHKKIHKP